MAESYATNPGELRLSVAKLRRLRPDLFRGFGRVRSALSRLELDEDERSELAEQVMHGDCQPAVVVSAEPLLVAAYTDELDCVVILSFPQDLAREYALEVQDTLISINVYWTFDATPDGKIVADLFPGRASRGIYANFRPMIGDFVSDDVEQIRLKKEGFSRHQLFHTWKLAQQYRKSRPQWVRDGRPGLSSRPCPQSGR